MWWGYVRAAVSVLDASAVSASIDTMPFFARDGPGTSLSVGRCAWYAVNVHNFCRPMGAPEASCERVGSHMQHAWCKRRNDDAGALMDAVRLHEAGVTGIGNPRDELICREVADAFLFLGRRPFLNERGTRQRVAAGLHQSKVLTGHRAKEQERLAASGRGSEGAPVQMLVDGVPQGSDAPSAGANAVLSRSCALKNLMQARSGRRALATPAMVPSAAAERNMRAATSERGVAALPLFLEDPRRAGQTGSAHRARLREWLRSDAGKEWLATKQQRLEEAE